MKKTKIVCTIGPATESEEMIKALILAGMNVARLNFSHGSHEEHKKRIDLIKSIREEMNLPIAIMLDTKGPEVRLGCFADGCADLVNGQEFILTPREMLGDDARSSISYKNLACDVLPGNSIFVADGLVELKVKCIDCEDVICEVINGGLLTNNKNVNVPGVASKLPALTEKDVRDLIFGVRNGVDFVAASFIRKVSDLNEVRKVLDSNGGTAISIIAKIENQEGVDNIDEILSRADGIMVARGDLGVELPPENMPLVQKLLIKKANLTAKPVITATQMLESMIENPRPTRAEVTDIANSIMDGTDAIMLSGETAKGKYPVEAVKMMAVIAKKTEESINFQEIGFQLSGKGKISLTDSVCHAASVAAYELEAAAIISPSNTGYTPKQLSKFRPKAPILATVPSDETARRLSLCFGVEALRIPAIYNTDELIEVSTREAKRHGYIKDNDIVIFCAGIPSGRTSHTNMMKISVVSE